MGTLPKSTGLCRRDIQRNETRKLVAVAMLVERANQRGQYIQIHLAQENTCDLAKTDFALTQL